MSRAAVVQRQHTAGYIAWFIEKLFQMESNTVFALLARYDRCHHLTRGLKQQAVLAGHIQNIMY